MVARMRPLLRSTSVDQDAELLERWRGGDATAGRALVDRHFDALRRFFARKLEAGVEDLIQSTFAACVAGKDRMRDCAGFRAYLFGIARHQLYAEFRARAAQRFDGDVTSLVELSPSPSAIVAQRDEHRRLLEALRRIPLDAQITIELYYWERLSTEELAEILQIPRSTVSTRLARARELLRRRIDELVGSGTHPAATDDDIERWATDVRDVIDNDLR
jgi:RNA polymerase sigma factor (sigma-70 family)